MARAAIPTPPRARSLAPIALSPAALAREARQAAPTTTSTTCWTSSCPWGWTAWELGLGARAPRPAARVLLPGPRHRLLWRPRRRLVSSCCGPNWTCTGTPRCTVAFCWPPLLTEPQGGRWRQQLRLPARPGPRTREASSAKAPRARQPRARAPTGAGPRHRPTRHRSALMAPRAPACTRPARPLPALPSAARASARPGKRRYAPSAPAAFGLFDDAAAAAAALGLAPPAARGLLTPPASPLELLEAKPSAAAGHSAETRPHLTSRAAARPTPRARTSRRHLRTHRWAPSTGRGPLRGRASGRACLGTPRGRSARVGRGRGLRKPPGGWFGNRGRECAPGILLGAWLGTLGRGEHLGKPRGPCVSDCCGESAGLGAPGGSWL